MNVPASHQSPVIGYPPLTWSTTFGTAAQSYPCNFYWTSLAPGFPVTSLVTPITYYRATPL